MKIALQRIEESRVTDWLPIPIEKCLPLFSAKLWQSFMQKVGWWLCVKFGVSLERPIERSVFNSIHIESDSILEKAHFNRDDLYRIWGREAKYVIVGSRTAAELWGEVAKNSFYKFPIEMRLSMNGQRPRLLGMEVVTVPWIQEGIFLLPELSAN